MGKFRNHTTNTNIMKNQNQFVQAMKCCLTNGKFALLLISSIFLFTFCHNRQGATEEVVTSNSCESLIGNWESEKMNLYGKYPTVKIKVENGTNIVTINGIFVANGDYTAMCQDGKLKVSGIPGANEVLLSADAFYMFGQKFHKVNQP